MTVWIYTLASTTIISLLGLIGVVTLYFSPDRLRAWLMPLVGFAAGSLLGNAFFELLPETIRERGFGLHTQVLVLAGIVLSFLLEQSLRAWQAGHPTPHEHEPHHSHLAGCTDEDVCEQEHGTTALLQAQPFALLDVVGDLVHNFIDGLVVGASFTVDIRIGLATSLAVVVHEIPHELGNFAVLIQSGLTRFKALLFNFLVALTAVLGGVTALLIGEASARFPLVLMPFTAGAFIYLAVGALIPELLAHGRGRQMAFAIVALIAGLVMMALLEH